MMAKILIVDDDKMFSDMLSQKMRKTGHEVSWAGTLKEACPLCRDGLFDLVYLEVNLPDGCGLTAIEQMTEASSKPEVIIITGEADADGAQLAIKSGAWDYVAKPVATGELMLSLQRALQYRRMKQVMRPSHEFRRERIIGSSGEMTACLDQAAQAASSDGSALITGETGTGKELISWAVHDNSSRAGKNFVVVDCAALSATLVESILFGYEKGAYTGADKSHDGLIKQADGGTLFLDEIGELPPAAQKSFLRVLQERRVRPLGGKAEIDSDFRLIAATNRDLDAMVADSSFRGDLLFRIRSFHIRVLALRKRRGDISELAEHYIMKRCSRREMPLKSLGPDFIDFLERYDWPGNVRELFGALERVLAAAGEEPVLFGKHLPVELRAKVTAAAFEADEKPRIEKEKDAPGIGKFQDVREQAMARAEYEYLKHLTKACERDVKKACTLSGLSRSRLYELLKKHDLRL